jgi:hypothetical protein
MHFKSVFEKLSIRVINFKKSKYRWQFSKASSRGENCKRKKTFKNMKTTDAFENFTH